MTTNFHDDAEKRFEDIRFVGDRLLALKREGHGQSTTDKRNFAWALAAYYKWLTGDDLGDTLAG